MSVFDYRDILYMHALPTILEPLDVVFHSFFYTLLQVIIIF